MRDQLMALWPSSAEVSNCIKKEAEAVDEAVFLAVHQSMRFLRRDIGTGGDTLVRSEADLLNEFLTPDLPEGRLILPIVGSSGVGKSHVIRWIDAQLRRRSDAHTRHIIRVPKGSSLKGVLHLLLRDLEGPAYDRLRTALKEARDHLDEDAAAGQLQLNLRLRLQRGAKAATERIAAGTLREGDMEMRAYGEVRMLPALLGDPLLEQEHWLRTPDGSPGVIAQLASQVTQQSFSTDDRRRHEFTPSDLVLHEGIKFSELGAQASRCYANLNRADDRRRIEAARVLNAVLDDAKNDLLRLGDNSLVELFGEVRAELLNEGRELVFLVEDFAVLSGLQGALLQVMITEATRDGVQHLCTMRTALAYTEGYMAGRDTVLTRATSEWLIEDRPGTREEILARIEQLVGAYLNAARVGQEALRAAFRAGSSEDHSDWIPMVDIDALEPEVRLMAEAFGRSADGYPLFPFNSGAVVQLSARGSKDSDGLLFNPRHVINNVLTKVLAERLAFEEGTFPPTHLADKLQSAPVTLAVSGLVPANLVDRHLMILRLWGDQPSTVEQASALSDHVYTAFGLTVPDFGVAPVQPRVVARPSAGTSQATPTSRSTQQLAAQVPQESPEAAALAEWRKELEAWSNGGVLEQRSANILRNHVLTAVHAYLPSDALLHKRRSEAIKSPSMVFLPRSRGQRDTTAESAFITVATDDMLAEPVTAAKVVELLMAFVARYEVYKSWDYDGASLHRARVRSFLAGVGEAAASELRKKHFKAELDATEDLVRGLLVGARALGIPGVHDKASTAALHCALYSDAPDLTAAGEGAWPEVQRKLAGKRASWRELLLELVGARQGGAQAVHAVDVAALAPAIELAKTTWELTSPSAHPSADPDYRAFTREMTDLRLAIAAARTREKQALVAWLPAAEAWFGPNLDKEAFRDALRDVAARAKKRGFASDEKVESLRRSINKLNTFRLAAAFDAATSLKASPTAGEELSILAKLPGRDVQTSLEFIAEANKFLDDVERQIAGWEAQFIDDPVVGTVAAIKTELAALEASLRACGEETP